MDALIDAVWKWEAVGLPFTGKILAHYYDLFFRIIVSYLEEVCSILCVCI